MLSLPYIQSQTLHGRTISHNSMPSAPSYHCRMGDGVWLLLNSYSKTCIFATTLSFGRKYAKNANTWLSTTIVTIVLHASYYINVSTCLKHDNSTTSTMELSYYSHVLRALSQWVSEIETKKHSNKGYQRGIKTLFWKNKNVKILYKSPSFLRLVL